MTSGGYVGLSIATLLSQHHKVTAVDIIPEKVELINNKKSPIQDEYIEKYLAEKELNLTATLDAREAYSDADFVVIAAPTNYDSKKNFFDTSAVEAVIKLVIEYNPEAIMVIKSTIPVGYTASVREKFHCDNIIFSPEFLRESKALYDNLYPSRIIVGTDVDNARLVKAAHTFAELLQEGAIKENIDTLFIVLNAYHSSGLVQRLFGHGFQSVYYILRPGGFYRFAHNSYIEYLYDYGTVGLILLLVFIIALIVSTIDMVRRKARFAPVMCLLLVISVFLGMFSYFFEESNIIMPVAVAYGVILGLDKKEKNIKDEI